jgi:hypothetical protein
MKHLFLLLILANIFLFLWEYREGGFNAAKKNSIIESTTIVEPILLANEIEKDSALIMPEIIQIEKQQTGHENFTTQPDRDNQQKQSLKTNESANAPLP